MTSSQSSIGFSSVSILKKILMAATVVMLIGFLIVHLIGNLQLFMGQEQLNKYAETLQSLGALKWGFRLFMVILAVVHIWQGFVLWMENRRARPVKYFREERVESTLFSRTMFWTGLLIFFFVAYHLMHFTMIVTNPEYSGMIDATGHPDVFSMVVTGFSQPIISVVYLIAMGLLAFHLSHAAESLFQTLGLHRTRYMPWLKRLSNLFAVVIFAAYASMPIAVLLNVITLPGGGR